MKFTIERAILLKALGHVQAVVERRNTIPILSNVLISASGGSVRLTATDLDMEIVEAAEAEVEREGPVTAPAHTLHEIARKLPEGSQVTLELDDGDPRLLLSAGRSRFQLPVLSAGDFPVMPTEDLALDFTAPASEIARLIDKTRFAVSTEETRYYLNGIHLHAADQDGRRTLRAVATDGHRLALAETDLPDGAQDMAAVIVPRKPIDQLRRLLEGLDDDISISVSEGKIRFRLGASVLTSKLIDGAFPDYERVIPRSNSKVMRVECAPFAQAVDRVATVSQEKSRSVKLSLASGQVTLMVNNPESGTASEALAADYGADEMTIGFNARYLLDVANLIKGDSAIFELADSGSPTRVTDSGDADVEYVLMPLRV